jgi:two-component sensor histidine kinase/CheY-like chemotaxis protein
VSERRKVLLVEDVRAEAALLQGLLSAAPTPFDVVWADRLAAALEITRREVIDAVLLDLTLPDGHGLGTLARMQEAQGAWPIIIVTGAEDENLAIQAIRLGAQDYLVKGSLDGRGISRAIRYAIDRKKQEEDLRKLSRTHRALSESRHAMMRAREEADLMTDVCRVVVEDCGYAMAWIGFAEEDEGKSVRPVARAGFEAGYLEALHLTWEDTERGRGPTGTAIRTKAPYICRNILTDPQFAPWRDRAVQRGYASSIAIPLVSGDRAFGAFMVYSRAPDPFGADEVHLLTELADDLAYGILAIRAGAARALLAAEKEVFAEEARRRADELDAIFEAIADAVVVYNAAGCPVKANAAAVRDLGFDPVAGWAGGVPAAVRLADALGKDIPLDGALERLERVTDGGREERLTLTNAEGRVLSVLASLAPLWTDGNRNGSVLVWHDLTNQERTERAVRRALEKAKEREAEVLALLASARAVLEKEAFEEAAAIICASCRELVGAQIGFFAVTGRQATTGRRIVLEPPEARTGIEELLARALELAGGGTLGEAGTAVYDNGASDAGSLFRVCDGEGPQNVLIAPMMMGERCVGVFGLAQKQGGFVDEDLRTTTAFAEISVVALRGSEARAQIQASLKEKEILLKEIHHRVKNNLQIIASMLNLQAAALRDEADRAPLIESQNRVRSLALIHEKLYRSQDLAKVPFKEYVSDLASFLVRSFQSLSASVDLDLDLEEVHLGVTTAIPLALILNELLSNALKHAFPGGRKGRIRVVLRTTAPKTYGLAVRDDGIGFPAGLDFRKTESLGLQLVCILTEQLGGEVELRRQGGTHFEVTFEDPG